MLDFSYLRVPVLFEALKTQKITFSPNPFDIQSAFLRGIYHRVTEWIIGKDHGRLAWLKQRVEQAQLGLQIFIKVSVIIEMIAAKIGKTTCRQSNTIQTTLIEAVG